MINFEILNSSDTEFNGTYLNHFDSFLVGSSHRADIVIEDPSINPLHLSLEVKEETIICRSYEKEFSFLVNNKKYSGTKVLKCQDVLSIGETSIRILNFALSENTEDLSIEEHYASSIEKVPQLEQIILQLEKEIIRLEQKQQEK